MKRPKGVAALVAVAMLTSGLALATGATADHFDPKKDKKTHKDWNANKPTYVNLAFFGDHFISCPTASVPSSVTVTVLDPADGSTVTSTGPHNVPVVGGTNVNPNTCLGGVSNSTTTQHPDQPIIPESWQVWATDFVWQHNGFPWNPTVNGVLELVCDNPDKTGDEHEVDCDGLTGEELGQDYIVVAGTAVMEIEVEQQKVKKGTGGVQILCVADDTIGPWSGTDVCLNAPDDEIIKVKRLTTFSFCGKGGVDGIDTSAWDKVKKFSNQNYTLTKQVFIDGMLLYLFDCGLTNLGPLMVERSCVFSPFCYNKVVDVWNTGWGVPGYTGEICDWLVCLFDFPALGADCWIDKPTDPADTAWVNDHLALPGIAGTIGWNHASAQTNLGCTEDVNEGNWFIQQGEGEVKVKSFPVQLTLPFGEDEVPVICQANNPRLFCSEPID